MCQHFHFPSCYVLSSNFRRLFIIPNNHNYYYCYCYIRPQRQRIETFGFTFYVFDILFSIPMLAIKIFKHSLQTPKRTEFFSYVIFYIVQYQCDWQWIIIIITRWITNRIAYTTKIGFEKIFKFTFSFYFYLYFHLYCSWEMFTNWTSWYIGMLLWFSNCFELSAFSWNWSKSCQCRWWHVTES